MADKPDLAERAEVLAAALDRLRDDLVLSGARVLHDQEYRLLRRAGVKLRSVAARLDNG